MGFVFGWVVLISLQQAPDVLQQAISQEMGRHAAPMHAEVQMISLQITQGESCAPQHLELATPLQGSARYAIRWSGDRCRGAAWATVRVLQSALVLTKDVRAGEPLEGFLTRDRREVRRSSRFLAALPVGAVSAVTLKAGAVLETHHIRDEGNQPGKEVSVWVKAGDVEVSQTGRIVACGAGRLCVRLPSGARVEGKYVAGRVVVEASL